MIHVTKLWTNTGFPTFATLMNNTPHRYFILNKPPDMVSQFKSDHKVGLLGDIDFAFPEGTHAIGRLDSHSEGLLLLTTNKKVTRLLFQGEVPHKRTYLVMVRHIVTPEKLEQLRRGVNIKVANSALYLTPACDVDIIEKPINLHPDIYPYRERGEHSWLSITLTEGKYHQVRKMVAAVGNQCKRLVRVSIEDIVLGDLPQGQVRELEEETFFRLLKIDNWR